MKRTVVPRFEPEVVAAEAKKKWHGDLEKVPTTSLKALDVHGVHLSSRYDKAREYEIMAAMVEGVSPELRRLIDNIFCDSKANDCYTVCLNPCTKANARRIAQQMEAACMLHGGGHNGITFEGAQGGYLDLDPRWPWGDDE